VLTGGADSAEFGAADHDTVEGILLLEDEAAVQAFRGGPTELDALMRAVGSHIKAYGVTKDTHIGLDIVGMPSLPPAPPPPMTPVSQLWKAGSGVASTAVRPCRGCL
jgi:hypothetical protein